MKLYIIRVIFVIFVVRVHCDEPLAVNKQNCDCLANEIEIEFQFDLSCADFLEDSNIYPDRLNLSNDVKMETKRRKKLIKANNLRNSQYGLEHHGIDRALCTITQPINQPMGSSLEQNTRSLSQTYREISHIEKVTLMELNEHLMVSRSLQMSGPFHEFEKINLPLKEVGENTTDFGGLQLSLVGVVEGTGERITNNIVLRFNRSCIDIPVWNGMILGWTKVTAVQLTDDPRVCPFISLKHRKPQF